jgi:ABC-2 type transport system ATP-binding protein
MIRLEKINKSYGGKFKLEDLDLQIDRGKFVSLLGPNGAGKTTIIRTIMGLLNPDSGRVYIDGEKYTRDSTDIKSKLGLVSQHLNLDKELTIYQNMVFAGKLYKLDKKYIKERIEYLFDKFSLSDHKNKKVGQLSGGMKRKLMIAKAIMHKPKVLFLDEPTVGIDLVSRKEIWTELVRLKEDGTTILLTTHYIDEAESLSDEVILIDNAKIFSQSSPADLIESLGSVTLQWRTSDYEEKYSYHRDLDSARDEGQKLEDNFTIRNTSLEDVFYNFTRKKVV